MTTPAERVRKLVALAASANENERRNAAVLACSLIREHGLAIGGSTEPADAIPDGWINDCGFVRPRTNGDAIAESIGTTKAAIHEETASSALSADALDRVATLISAASTTTRDVRLARLALARSTLAAVEERANSLALRRRCRLRRTPIRRRTCGT
jgi:Protein of unknown function (DUF2786)